VVARRLAAVGYLTKGTSTLGQERRQVIAEADR
jgi:hypothetical protein